MKPTVSVVMACYKEPVGWLEQAVDSILQQTFNSLELIVVVDNPQHMSAIKLLESKQQQDERLQILVNTANIGLPMSLNQGFAIARGIYFARMDADDIAHPERLVKQVHELETNADIHLLGTAITNIDSEGNVLGDNSFLTSPIAIQKAIAYRSVACHPTWLMRKEVFQRIGGYRYFPSSEDYDFLYRVLDAGFRISNIPEPLLNYRLHDSSMTSALSNFQYAVKHYIQSLHRQRLSQKNDQYCEQVSKALKSGNDASKMSKSLVTRARAAEESKNYPALALWGGLAVIFSGAGIARIKSFIGFNYIKWRYEN